MSTENSWIIRFVPVWLAAISLIAGACSSADEGGVGASSADKDDGGTVLVQQGPGIDVSLPSGVLANELEITIEMAICMASATSSARM